MKWLGSHLRARSFGQVRRAFALTTAFGLVMSLAVCGCTPESAECAPEGITRASETQAARFSSKAAPVAIDLYLDASQSMEGFVKPPAPPPPADKVTYPRIIKFLGAYLQKHARDSGQEIWNFGACLHNIKSSFGAGDPALKSEFYKIQKVNECPGDNFYMDTRLDQVFTKINGRRADGRLSIVVTDFFLTEGKETGEVRKALEGPVRPIFAAGSTIGVLGIKVPFQGKVQIPKPYLSNKLDRSEIHATVLTLYILLVGQREHIDHFLESLAASTGAQGWADRSDKSHYHVFTANRFTAPITNASAFHDEAGKSVQSDRPFVREQQKPIVSVTLDDRKSFSASADLVQVPGTWKVDLGTSVRAWSFHRGSDCPSSWKEADNRALHVKSEDPSADGESRTTRINVSLDKSEIMSFPREVIYLSQVDAVVQRRSPRFPPWIEDWSLLASGVGNYQRGSPPTFVKTLELEYSLRALEEAALEATSVAPSAANVASFSVAYRRKN